MPYFVTPNYSIGLNTKVGSSSLSLAVIKAYQPDRWSMIENGAYPPGRGPEDFRFHPLAKKELTASKPVLLLVRDPIERFLSACAQVGINNDNLNAALDSLESGEPMAGRNGPRANQSIKDNEHFTFQYMLQYGETYLYKFPDHLDALATKAGLSLPLPVINEASLRPKPTLLQAQELRVREYYARDIVLFDSITEPGMMVTIDPESLKPLPKEPVPSEVSPLQIRRWLILNGISMAMVDAAISAIPDPIARQIAAAEWEFGLSVQRSNPMINQMGAAFGLTPSQMDQAFRESALFYL